MGMGKWLLTDIWSAEARDALNIVQGPEAGLPTKNYPHPRYE